MLWVLQRDLYSEPGYRRLLEALVRLECKHVVVKPVYFSATEASSARLVHDDCPGGEVDELPEPVFDTNQPIMVMGSYTLVEIGLARGWKPCAFTDNIDVTIWNQKLPHNWLLNDEIVVQRFADVFFYADMFVRPTGDSKAFKGAVYEAGEFAKWQSDVLAIPPADRAMHMLNGKLVPQLDADTMVAVAQPKVIHSETRCFVVKGRVVTASVYKRGDTSFWQGMKLDTWARVDDEVIRFAQTVANVWGPNEAYVLDVASTPSGPRVVEYNCINSAGFYACDVMALVSALNDLG